MLPTNFTFCKQKVIIIFQKITCYFELNKQTENTEHNSLEKLKSSRFPQMPVKLQLITFIISSTSRKLIASPCTV